MTRTLTLRKDTLAELTADDLRAVTGGDAGITYTCFLCHTGLTVCGICDDA